MIYYMVEEELIGIFNHIVEGGHGLFPLSKVIDDDDHILVATIGGRLKFHRVYSLFAKGDGHND